MDLKGILPYYVNACSFKLIKNDFYLSSYIKQAIFSSAISTNGLYAYLDQF